MEVLLRLAQPVGRGAPAVRVRRLRDQPQTQVARHGVELGRLQRRTRGGRRLAGAALAAQQHGVRQPDELPVPAAAAGAGLRYVGVVPPAHAPGQHAEQQDDPVFAELAGRRVLRVVGQCLRELLLGGVVPLLQQRTERPRQPVRHRPHARRVVDERSQLLQCLLHLGAPALVGPAHRVGQPQQGQGPPQPQPLRVGRPRADPVPRGLELAAPDLVQGEDEAGLVRQRRRAHAQGLLPGLLDPVRQAVVARGDPGQVHLGGHPQYGQPVRVGEGAGPCEVCHGGRLVPFPGELPEHQQGLAGHGRQVGVPGRVRRPAGEPGGGGQPVGCEPAQLHVRRGEVHAGGVGRGRAAPEQPAGHVQVPEGFRGPAPQGGDVGQSRVQPGPAPGGHVVVAAQGFQAGDQRGDLVEPGRAGDGVEQLLQYGGVQFGCGGGVDEAVGPGEQRHRPLHRALGHRPPRRLAVQAYGLLCVAGVSVQLRGLRAPDSGQTGVQVGQCARRAPRVPGALARSEVAEQSLRGQLVAERVPLRARRVRHDQARGEPCAQDRGQLPVVAAGRVLEHRQREARAEQGRRVQEFHAERADPLGPASDAVRDGGGDGRHPLVAGGPAGEVVDELLDQEGDPGAEGHRAVDELGAGLGRGGSQLGRDEEVHVGPAEGAQVEYRRGPALAGPRGQFGRRAGFAPRDEQEQGRLWPDVVQQVLDDRQRPGVGVVQVVEDEQAAPLPSDDGDQAQDRLGDHEG